MPLKIRLARGGAKKRPYYRIVVADARARRDGNFIEKIGTYNPMLPQDHADRVRLDVDRAKHWVGVGAQPTDRVARMLGKADVIPMPEIRETPKKSAPGKKAQERLEEKAKADGEAKADAEAAAAPAEDPPAEEPAAEEPAAEETPA